MDPAIGLCLRCFVPAPKRLWGKPALCDFAERRTYSIKEAGGRMENGYQQLGFFAIRPRAANKRKDEGK